MNFCKHFIVWASFSALPQLIVIDKSISQNMKKKPKVLLHIWEFYFLVAKFFNFSHREVEIRAW